MVDMELDAIASYYSTSKPKRTEMVWIDPAKTRETNGTLTLSAKAGGVRFETEGTCEVRPNRMKTDKKRLDLYVNVNNLSQLIQTLQDIGVQDQGYQKGTDPTRFVKGNIEIPHKETGPKLIGEDISIHTPKWDVSGQATPIYSDLQTDNEAGRGSQLHVGIPYDSLDCSFTGRSTSTGDFADFSAGFTVASESIDDLYSFIVNTVTD